MEEHLDHIEALPRELHVAQVKDHAILEQVQDHLMGSLEVRDYDIHCPSRGRGSLSARSTLAQRLMDRSLRRQS